ncbi:MAG TPA: WecB/TagA/CpsF family glycosyltransferase [Chloroflexia bacterium]|nr:WecB/TagA/CpsF family glycosyltransferase [Chloroflexia bacterium]
MDISNFLGMRYPRRRINILEVLVDEITLEEAVDSIEKWVMQRRENPNLPGKRIVTANPEYVMCAQRDRELLEHINTAAMVTPDGVGLIAAGLLFRSPFRTRVTGVELSYALAKRSAENGMRIFLLGAAPGVAEEAADNLRKLYPGVNIVGCFAGKAGPEGDAETVLRVKEAQAEIVLVAYGQVKQDYWAVRNLDKCQAAVSIGVGGTFDFISGRVKHAPKYIRKTGMEWAYRLYQQPWRWKRDLAMFHFASIVIWMSFFKLRVMGGTSAVVYQFDNTGEALQVEVPQVQTA